LLTVAVNCFVASTITEAVVGEIEITTIGGGAVELPPPPPQEDTKRQKSAAVASTAKMVWF
jgi:hypothetical protein